jgi:hypothetical protein
MVQPSIPRNTSDGDARQRSAFAYPGCEVNLSKKAITWNEDLQNAFVAVAAQACGRPIHQLPPHILLLS